ncbi:DJ-1/PfpI family protein [Aquimarina sp. D1M17]|uniref:GlxA family transcriptional regulator n=1 Tax=Aquimarina acroporae TaxID=2937283 RepID=UPI0020C049F3|nr:DJ-1/PfpI family protein [Aquimarina acroporae]MCK8522221.1 DJ-1/PfpI family protein [Aquimarina acroporae]
MKKKVSNKIVFFVPEKVHLLDLCGPAQVFYEAENAGAPLEVVFAGFNSLEGVKSSAGLAFNNLLDIENLKLTANDYVFIPGSENVVQIINSNKTFLNLIKRWNSEKVNICSICVGVFWLASLGLVDGKKSTTHWRYLDLLERKHPNTIIQKNNLFVIEQNLYMSAGVSSGIDLSLYIIEKLYGYNLTLKVSKEIVYYFRRAGDDPQISTFLKYRNHIDNSVHKIQDYIIKNINKKITLDDMAIEVNMSKRNLSRKFKKTTDITVGKYIEMVRLERINHLLSNGLKMEQVAIESGLKSTNQVRNLIKKYSQNLSI